MAADRQGTLAGALLGLVAAGLGVATAFGIHITSQEHAAILTFCGAVALAAPLVGAVFDHGKAQAISRVAAATTIAAGPQAVAPQAQAAIIQAQIDELAKQKAALPS